MIVWNKYKQIQHVIINKNFTQKPAKQSSIWERVKSIFYLRSHQCSSLKNKDELIAVRTAVQFHLFVSLYGCGISRSILMKSFPFSRNVKIHCANQIVWALLWTCHMTRKTLHVSLETHLESSPREKCDWKALNTNLMRTKMAARTFGGRWQVCRISHYRN